MNLEELCSWLSHQKGMMAQTYAKDLAKYIVRTKELQIKELSDEEIKSIGREHIDVEWFDEGEYGMQYNIYGMVEFARAILKKAQEK